MIRRTVTWAVAAAALVALGGLLAHADEKVQEGGQTHRTGEDQREVPAGARVERDARESGAQASARPCTGRSTATASTAPARMVKCWRSSWPPVAASGSGNSSCRCRAGRAPATDWCWCAGAAAPSWRWPRAMARERWRAELNSEVLVGTGHRRPSCPGAHRRWQAIRPGKRRAARRAGSPTSRCRGSRCAAPAGPW